MPLETHDNCAVLFADMSGSTKLYLVVGDDRAREIVAKTLDRWSQLTVADGGQVIQLRSLAVPDPPVDPERLAEIEEQYLARYFRAEQDIRRITAGYRERVAPAPTTTRYQPLGER